MIDYICKNQSDFSLYIVLVIMLVKELFEYWLGKTPKTKSGSVLELILRLLTGLFKKKDPQTKET